LPAIKACKHLGLSLRTVQRWRHNLIDARKGSERKVHHKLTLEEEQQVLATANSQEFVDKAPHQIVAHLADREVYLASESTFYRLLKKAGYNQHRARTAPKKHQKPKSLIATGPNQVWTWDITYLKGPRKGHFYYLYLIVDVFSRKIILSRVHEKECSYFAAQMIQQAYQQEKISPSQVHLHSDNGGPMKGAPMLAMLQKLGITPTFSRPRVSDDNPYSEALFRTLKYRIEYPKNGFNSLEESMAWCERFENWYNHEHLHSAIKWVTPASRHEKKDTSILKHREVVYAEARFKNPLRWSGKIRDWSPIKEVQLHPENERNHYGIKPLNSMVI
jgi:putative transposase